MSAIYGARERRSRAPQPDPPPAIGRARAGVRGFPEPGRASCRMLPCSERLTLARTRRMAVPVRSPLHQASRRVSAWARTPRGVVDRIREQPGRPAARTQPGLDPARGVRRARLRTPGARQRGRHLDGGGARRAHRRDECHVCRTRDWSGRHRPAARARLPEWIAGIPRRGPMRGGGGAGGDGDQWPAARRCRLAGDPEPGDLRRAPGALRSPAARADPIRRAPRGRGRTRASARSGQTTPVTCS